MKIAFLGHEKKILFPITPKERAYVLKKLQENRVNNVQMLIKWSFEDLRNLEKGIWSAWEIHQSEIMLEKLSQLNESISIKSENEKERKLRSNLAPFISLMLRLNLEVKKARLPDRTEQLNTRIDFTKGRINEMVNEINALTEEKIKIVENK